MAIIRRNHSLNSIFWFGCVWLFLLATGCPSAKQATAPPPNPNPSIVEPDKTSVAEKSQEAPQPKSNGSKKPLWATVRSKRLKIPEWESMPTELVFHPTDPVIYTGSPREMSTSRDGGETWRKLKSTNGNMPNHIAIDPTSPKTLYTGGFMGMNKSTDGGVTWSKIRLGDEKEMTVVDLRSIVVAPTSPTTVYVAISEKGVFKSTDGGRSWKVSNNGLTNKYLWTLAIAPNKPATIYALASGSEENDALFKSTDGGNSWEALKFKIKGTVVDADMKNPRPFVSEPSLYDIAIHPTNDNILYVAADQEGVMKTTDGGVSWSSMDDLPEETFSHLAMDMTAPDTVYAGNFGGLFKTTNGGQSWDEITPTLPIMAEPTVEVLALDPKNPTNVFVGIGSRYFFRSTNGGGSWSAMTPEGYSFAKSAGGPWPEERNHATMAYDVARKNAVMFGGTNGRWFVGDTWTWNGRSWTEHTSKPHPNMRWLHAMAYDSKRKVVVLFGGSSRDTPTHVVDFNDTWEWDGTKWEIRKPKTRPQVRGNHAMAYDSKRGVVVLYGGAQTTGPKTKRYFDDTWEWDGEDWKKRKPKHQMPRMAMHAMAYDSKRGVVVMSGGYAEPEGDIQGTWEWDGTNWTEKKPATFPSVRNKYALAYDEKRGVVVLFGGGNGRDLSDETWTWDGTNWIKQTPKSRPSARFSHAMAYDPTVGHVLMFNGASLKDFYNDLWAWDGTNWTQK